MRRLVVIALMLAVMSSVQAEGFSVPSPVPETPGSQRVIPSDPKLPKYDNPTEIDLDDGKLHISFQGVFRGIDKNKNYVAFAFIATPQTDMVIWLNKREVFDGRSRRFNDWDNAYIGVERTTKREIIACIPVQIIRWLKMPESEAGLFPTIARAEFCFNDKWFQYRNIKVEEWKVWENIKQELGL